MPLVSVDAKKIAQRVLEAKDRAAAEAAKVEKKPDAPVLVEPVKDFQNLSD